MTILWGGLALGAVYALVAIGYNIVFIASKTFNFAHAQLMMVGTFVAYTGLVTLHWSWPAVVFLGAAVVALLAAVEERVAIRPLADADAVLVTTLGAAILLDGASQLIWGAQPLGVPFGSSSVVTFLGGRVFPDEFYLVGICVLLVVVFSLLTKRTFVGWALLAMSEDPEAATLRGINVRLLSFAAFAFAGGLAGLLGVFVGAETFAVATLGTALALKGFVAVAIGGFGSMPGTLVGGMVVGLVEGYSDRYFASEYSDIAIFGVLVLVLLLRPSGLFVRARERVV